MDQNTCGRAAAPRHSTPEAVSEDAGRSQPEVSEVPPDAVSRELYAMFARIGRRREQKETTASVSGEEGLLHYLAYRKDGVHAGVLKDQLQVGSGRMADILKRLEEKQMIIRTEDPEDSRRVIVTITERGREQAVRTSCRVHALYQKLCEYLGEEDSRELLRILNRLSDFHT